MMRDSFYESSSDNIKNFVLLGESGSGKSEIALNLAALLAKAGDAVDLFDLDQTKPLFRSRDMQERMEEAGVNIFWEEQLLDTPVIAGGVGESLRSGGVRTILDIGGFEIGARAIGRFSRLLDAPDTKALYVVNPFRPWTKDRENILKTMDMIRGATGLAGFEVIINPHLGPETTADEFLEGLKLAKERLPKDLPLLGACCRRELAGELEAHVDMPLMPMELFLKYEWIE